MSLKNILSKITASFIVMYMVFGNFMIAGMGLGKVIAEDTNMPKISIENKLEKYASYSNELGKGAVIQIKVSVGEETSKEQHKEISKTDIQVEVPRINGILPERINIITANTKLTNGKEKEEISQNYNRESGLLNISYENKDNYKEYQEQVKDEFEIIYIYPQEAYTEENIKTAIKVTATREYKLENGKATGKSEKREEIILSKEIDGEIAGCELTDASEIYKGYLYANEQNKTNYETNYKTTANLSILNSELMDEIKIDLAKSAYITTENNEQKDVDTNTSVYKSTKVAEEDFNKLFGQDGYIDFYTGDTKYATIRYLEPDEKGNRAYATYYHVEGIENQEAGKVEYQAGTTNVTIVTSKPQTEGKLNIENEKAIKASRNYGKAVKDINGIKETNKIEATKKYIVEEDKKDENRNAQKEQIEKTVVVSQKENNGIIELKEPTTQMELLLDNTNLSTLSNNKVRMTIKLNDTNSSCNLFEEETLEISLPSHLISSKITGTNILYENGLKIANEEIKNGKVIIDLTGKQTQYDIQNISGGTNIVLDLELDIDDLVATHTETLNLTYGKTKASTNVTIQSKAGLLVKNTVQTNQGKQVVLIDNSEKDIQVATGVQSEQAINLVNNYDKDLNNVEVMGLLGYKNSEVVSDFDLKLMEAVKVSGVDAKVYYSKTATNQEWTENFIKDAKAYKVVIDNLKAKSNATINMKVSIPDNLENNKESYLTTNVGYTYENNRLTQNSFVKLATDKKIEEPTFGKNLSVKFTTEFNPNAIYSEGTKITYYADIRNTTQENVKNVEVKNILPNELEYIDAYVVKGNQLENYEENKGKQAKYNKNNKTVTWDIGDLSAGENKIIILKTKIINLPVGETMVPNEIVTSINGKEECKASQSIYVSKADVDVQIQGPDKQELKSGDAIKYKVQLKNTTKLPVLVNILDNFDENIELQKIIYYIDNTTKTENTQYLNGQKFETDIILEAGSEKIIELECKVNDLKEGIEQKEIENFVVINYEGKTKQSNAIKNVIIQTKQNDNPSKPEEPENPNVPDNPNKPSEETKYTIAGQAWLDTNKNGQKEEEEKKLDGINVMLMDATIGEPIKDANGNNITAITDQNGNYQFENLKNGNYLVIFEFDTKKYTVTNYQKEGVSITTNSDAIISNVNIEGNNKTVGITNKLEITNQNLENIDIGLIENANFDLSLEKQISSITVTNNQGNKTTNYENENFAKVDLVAKYMNNTNVIVTYKFVITNKGDVTGYVDELVDNLPSGLEFSSELNKEWYKGSDGKLYTTSLSGIAIEPGKTSEIELILTKKTTENTTGTFTNNAEITQVSNIEAIQEKTQAKENNKSQANIVISIKTGTPIMYISLTMGCIAIIGMGAYIIKKKIINKGI